MTGQAPIEDLVRLMEAHDPAATAALESLQDRCLVDDRNRTLFDVAIRAENAEAIAVLASDAGALGFCAPVDPELERRIKHTAATFEVEIPLSKLETILEDSFGAHLAYGRTPLHTACHAGNAGAIEALLAAGAGPGDKDVLGLTAPELALFAHGEAGLTAFLEAFARAGQDELPVNARLLEETLAFPAVLDELLRVAKLDATARRLLFCYHCSWLDADAVRGMLAEGLDVNKGVTASRNPLWEACTSELLWGLDLPGGREVAFHYVKHSGLPGSHATSFDNALLNEDGSNFGKLFAQAERERKALVREAERLSLEPEAERRLIERRIELLDILLEAGLDVGLARKKASSKLVSDFSAELREMKLGELARHLESRDGGAVPRKPPKPAATTWWELAGETVLTTEYFPSPGKQGKAPKARDKGKTGKPGKASKAGQIRLVLSDTYGPVDGITLSARLTRGKKAPDGDWRALRPVEDTIEIDGEWVPRADLSEPVYGPAPWQSVYELPLDGPEGANVLWIRLDHPEDSALRGDLDPWQFAKA